MSEHKLCGQGHGIIPKRKYFYCDGISARLYEGTNLEHVLTRPIITKYIIIKHLVREKLNNRRNIEKNSSET